jgi:hypothetical protein
MASPNLIKNLKDAEGNLVDGIQYIKELATTFY